MAIDLSTPISLPYFEELGALPNREDPPAIPEFAHPALQPNPVSVEEILDVPTSHPSPSKRVSNSHLLFAAGVVFICIWAVANLWWTPIARLISYVQHRSLYQGIEKAQIEKLREGLQTIIEDKWLGKVYDPKKPGYTILNRSQEHLFQNIRALRPSGDPKAARELVEKVTQIREMVETLEKKGSSLRLDVESVQSLIAETMKLPLYRDLEDERNCYAVNFVQCLAIKLISADGVEALAAYGKKSIGEEVLETPDQTFSPTAMADHLSGYLKRFSFNADGYGPVKEGRLIWTAAHPLRAIHSLYSHTHPLLYDATQSNPYIGAHAFLDSDSGKKLDFYYGPGPTGSPFFEHGVLPAYRKFDTFELRFNHQNMQGRGDNHRIQDAIRMESPHHFHAVFSFDKPWAKAICKRDYRTPEAFFASIKHHVYDGLREMAEDRKRTNGVYIPKDLLNDAQVDQALNKAQEFCEKIGVHNRHWLSAMQTKEGKEQMGKMMIHIADTFMMLGLVYKSFDMITPEMIQNQLNDSLDHDLFALRVSGACKQDVDRAIVNNISLRLLFRWTTDPSPLTGDEVCEIAGAVFGRARLVDDRNMLGRRYQILDDLLRFVGNDQGVLNAHIVLSSFRNEMNKSLKTELSEPVRSGIISSLVKPAASWFASPFSYLKRRVFG